MSTRVRFLTCLSVALALVVAAALQAHAGEKPPAAKRTAAKPAPDRAGLPGPVALFAVSQNRAGASLDPIVLIHKGKYTNPPSGTAGSAQLQKFARTYYRAGQKYRLLFGGGEAGSVSVRQWNQRKECSRTEATVLIHSDAKIQGRVMGLATNSATLGKRPRSRRAPAEQERRAMEALARRLYRQKGIAAPHLPSMRTINITATNLNGDRQAEMIGTFLLKPATGVKAAHILFVIAEPKGNSFSPAFTQYGQISAKDVGSLDQFDELGDSALAEVLVDQIDLDSDGTAEVIIADLTPEGVAYKIFQKRKTGWRKAYEFYNYRCG